MKVSQQLGLLLGFLTVSAVYSAVYACPSTSAPVSFEYVTNPEGGIPIVRLTNSETKAVRDIEDEDGVISIHMVLARIHAIGDESGSDDLDIDKNRELLAFLAKRISDFENAISNYPMGIFLRSQAQVQVAKFKREVDKALKPHSSNDPKGKVSAEKLKQYYYDLNRIFYDGGISPTARIKEPGEAEFGEPTLLSDIQLPDLETSRGFDNCNVKVGGFNVGAGVSAAKSGTGVD